MRQQNFRGLGLGHLKKSWLCVNVLGSVTMTIGAVVGEESSNVLLIATIQSRIEKRNAIVLISNNNNNVNIIIIIM